MQIDYQIPQPLSTGATPNFAGQHLTGPQDILSAGTTTTSSDINALGAAGTGAITVGSTTGWPASGYLVADSEAMAYSVVSGTSINITARARFNSTGAAHTNGVEIDYAVRVDAASVTAAPRFMQLSSGRIAVGVVPTNTTLGGFLRFNNVDAYQIIFDTTHADPSFFLQKSGAIRAVWGVNSAQSVTLGRSNSSPFFIVADTADKLVFQANVATTNAVVPRQQIELNTTGVAAAGLGIGVEHEIENAGGTNVIASRYDTVWQVATAAAETADAVINLINAGAFAESHRFKAAGGILSKYFLVVDADGATSLASDSGTTYSNEGAAALDAFNLPTAVAGLEFEYIVQDADGIQVNAAAGDTIRLVASVSAAAGFIKSTVIGSVVRLKAINATEWIGTLITGTWTVDI